MTAEQRAVLLAQAVGEDVKALREQKLDKTGGAVTGNVVFQVPNDGSLGFQFSGTDDDYGFNVEVFADSQGKLRNAFIGFPDGAGLTLGKATNTAWFSGWVGAAGGFGDVDSRLSTKVDKVAGKQLSTEDYTTADKNKLAGIAAGANNYTHPANHPASIIEQDADNRFVTDAEKAAWGAKVAQTDVGSAPNELPGNQHLGALAFLDALGATQVTRHTRDSQPGDVWHEYVSDTQLVKKFHGFDNVIRTITETYA